eukprot:COSAG06_NODE_6715_length_2812_cov_706.046812_2_plen_224_part_00
MGCGRCALPAGTRAGHATVILLFVMSACVLRMQPILGTTSITSLTNWLASVALTATVVVLVPTKLAVRYARRPLCTLGLTALALVCCAATVDTYVGIVHGRMQGMGVAAAVASGLYVARLWPLASRYRKMPILASLNAKNRSKSPFSIGLVFSIVSESTVLLYYVKYRNLEKTIHVSHSNLCCGGLQLYFACILPQHSGLTNSTATNDKPSPFPCLPLRKTVN